MINIRKSFDYGIYAKVTIKENPKINHVFYDSGSIFDLLIDTFDFEKCENAEAWSEIACVGEIYEDDNFIIEMKSYFID